MNQLNNIVDNAIEEIRDGFPFPEILEETIPHKFEKNYIDARKGEIKVAYSSIDQANRELMYSPKYSLQEGLQEYIEYEKMQIETND